MSFAAPRIILASASPRRRELLALIRVPHEVLPADIDETVTPGEVPAAYTERLAREKAAVVARREPEAVIIAADTTVVIDGRVLGKPDDRADAARMLRLLSGRANTVYTAVAVARASCVESDVEMVTVTFRQIGDAEIDSYIATGEPMDKAGAYGIQGYGATIIERIDGDYFAVMGLPLLKTVRLLGKLGVRYDFGRIGWDRDAHRE